MINGSPATTCQISRTTPSNPTLKKTKKKKKKMIEHLKAFRTQQTVGFDEILHYNNKKYMSFCYFFHGGDQNPWTE